LSNDDQEVANTPIAATTERATATAPSERYDCDGEYEFAIARHWIAPEATAFPGKTGLP
jgi:hypothetical protein